MFPLVILVLGTVAWRMYTSFKHLSTIPKEVPWVGRTGNFSTYLLSQIKAIRNTPSAINEAYNMVFPLYFLSVAYAYTLIVQQEWHHLCYPIAIQSSRNPRASLLHSMDDFTGRCDIEPSPCAGRDCRLQIRLP
jgi:hypothetical protein